MILYHFTSSYHLPLILKSNLSEGDIPLVPGRPGYRGVWFTTDECPAGHGLSTGQMITIPKFERSMFRTEDGLAVTGAVRTRDKHEVRIKVVIPSSDRNLFHWIPWSVKRTEPNYREALIRAGGGRSKADTWFIYNGVISPKRFIEVGLKSEREGYIPINSERLAELGSGSTN